MTTNNDRYPSFSCEHCGSTDLDEIGLVLYYHLFQCITCKLLTKTMDWKRYEDMRNSAKEMADRVRREEQENKLYGDGEEE